jgi:SpoVK/Ycf46/Vps4 family AAA+-type ATPase
MTTPAVTYFQSATSNLRASATIVVFFTRRFRFIIHFPRPTETDRCRIWHLALPDSAPLAADVDLDQFARLDTTGAAIVSAARTAALLAASGDGLISFEHLTHGVERQYRHEARMLLNMDLQLCRRRDGTTD